MTMMLSETFKRVKAASKSLVFLTDDRRNEVLQALADAIESHIDCLLAANTIDLSCMDKANPMYDRLQLTPQRLHDIANDMRHVSQLPSPLGRTLKEKTLDNGLHLRRVSTPFGVIGMIYEARPNVTFDVFSLCFKSGNACILKGGKDADESNRAGVALIHDVLKAYNINPSVVELLPASHEATEELLTAVGFVDLCIPRGSKRLIDFVRNTAKVPVIETGAGVVHCYFDEAGDLTEIVERTAEIFEMDVTHEAAKELALRSRGTPRIANRLLKRVRDYAQIMGNGLIDDKITDQALSMLDVDQEGLDYVDQKILKTMIEVYGGGPVGLGTLSVNIAEERETVEDMYEPYLIQKGFVMRTRTGRVATRKAYEHLGYEYMKE